MAAIRNAVLWPPVTLGRSWGAILGRRPRRLAMLVLVLATVLALPFFIVTPQGRGAARAIYELHYKLDAIPGFSSVHHGLHGALESDTNGLRGASTPEIIRGLLMRSGYGPGGESVTALFAPPEYFQLTQQAGQAAQYQPDKNLVFLIWEDIHSGDLPDPLAPLLRVDGGPTYSPKLTTTSASAVHHRASILVYSRQDQQGNAILGDDSRSLELVLPPANEEGAQSILQWTLPVTFPEDAEPVAFQFTWASVMALLGGLLASMWPCLFQLTAYFIPTLAGLTMAQASQREAAAAVRRRVLKTALFFVAGIVIMYTLAGAAAGFAAQSFGGTSIFETWRRPLSMVAGLVVLFMAVRVAINARAPFACKMPVFPGLRAKGSGYLGTMFLGVAFATGCTTCFGAAIIIAMLAYVGTTGTALYGALTLFIFSLGIAIPLVVGAMAMARVLTLLGRLERFAPWMALTSSAVMVGFAILLLSDRFMWLSNRVGGAAPFA